MPVTVYEGSRPIFMNRAFHRISGYSREDVEFHCKRYGEAASLFYSESDLADVRKKLSDLGDTAHGGYRGVEFTLTRNPKAESHPGERVTLAWSTFNWMGKTVRSARFVRMEGA